VKKDMVTVRKMTKRTTRNEVGEVERVMKKKDSTFDDAVNWQIWRKATEKQ
jgi:hypothetical protein